MNPKKVGFTQRQLKAIEFAQKAHHTQRRKGTVSPYIIHPIEVAYLCGLYYPDEENLIIAGYLHDVVEDSEITLAEIQAEFGARVSKLVQFATTITPFSWKEHRQVQIDKIHASQDELAVILKAADMLSNATSMARDYRLHGTGAFDIFKSASPGDVLWYYASSARAIKNKLGPEPIVEELNFQISEWGIK